MVVQSVDVDLGHVLTGNFGGMGSGDHHPPDIVQWNSSRRFLDVTRYKVSQSGKRRDLNAPTRYLEAATQSV